MLEAEMASDSSKPHDSATPVPSVAELEALLVAGLESGEPSPMLDDDWDTLRRRAMLDTEPRKSV